MDLYSIFVWNIRQGLLLVEGHLRKDDDRLQAFFGKVKGS